MARASMSELIALLRKLTNASVNDFSDDEVQEFLDAHRLDVRLAPLRGEHDLAGQYFDYYADVGNWEQDAVLQDAAGNVLNPAVSEWLVGRWQFSDHTPPPVYITGKVYDVSGAAADILEAWAAKVALEFDFEDGAKFQRSQKQKALLSLAREYRSKAWPIKVTQVRKDIGG